MTWKFLFDQTKSKLEEERGDRWDFDQKPIKERLEYIVNILNYLMEIAQDISKFLVVLGPKLKAVTGNIEKIDKLIEGIMSITDIFDDINFNYFEKQFFNNWKTLYTKYNVYIKEIQQKTIKLIQSTFSDLRNSESAYELLQKFKNL